MPFEERGIERQYNARNITEAKRAFENSCDFCCNTGKHLDCDRCRIASAHNTVITLLNIKTLH